MKPLIKATASEDVSALQNVLEATQLFPAEMLPDMLAPALAGEAEAMWLTCHHEGAAIGFCFTTPEELTDGTCNMRALAVHPDVQGRQFGAALVAATEDRLRKDGYRVLIVDTSGTDDFARIRAFYAKNGYEEEARIRDFWAAGDDKVIFRKAL